MSKPNWNELVIPLTKHEIKEAIADPSWQEFRIKLWGTGLRYRYHALRQWLAVNGQSRRAQVQVANYINALKRGGLI